jgi:hypothetical protein
MDWVMRSLRTAAALCALALALAGASLAAPIPESSGVLRATGDGNSWSSLGRGGGVHVVRPTPRLRPIGLSSLVG